MVKHKFLIFLSALFPLGIVAQNIPTVTIFQDCSKNGITRRVGNGTENGRDYVDLGLPSGLMWATCNVGATTPEGYGDYFAWGETSPKSTYNWTTYKYGGYSEMYKYCMSLNDGRADYKSRLELLDDAAHVNWGGAWRMPTYNELNELKTNCTWTWTSNYNSTGVEGYIVKSKAVGNSNSIFLPATKVGSRAGGYIYSCGDIWSSSLCESSSTHSKNAYCLDFASGEVKFVGHLRYENSSVRPVCQNTIATPTPTSTNCTLTLYADGCNTPNTFFCASGQQVNITAKEIDGYQFVSWSDGNTDNPRLVTITNDVTYTASFQLITSGQCGNNLYWNYNQGQLIITGSGAMYDYTLSNSSPWNLLRDSIITIDFPTTITSIGNNAFYNCYRLISVTIPNSVTAIGSFAFCNVNNIVYDGTATGSPWGAKCVNGYVDGYLVYTDATKTTLAGCSGAATGKIIVPMGVSIIKENAFSGCNKLDSVYIENYFTTYQSNSFPSTTKIKVLTSVTAEQTSKNLCSATIHMTISDALKNYYDEIGIGTRGNIDYIPNEKGDIYLRFSTPLESGWYYCDIYAKKNAERITKGEVRIYTKTPSLSCSSSSTQTTITLSNIYASTDTSVYTFSKGIYYNGRHYEADKNDKVVITGIVPNTECTLQVYGCYNGQYYYGAEKYVTTQAIAPILSVTESPTCVYAKGSYTHGDATILGTSVACTTTGSSVAGDEGLITGLKPNTNYSFTYSVDTKEGGTYTATKTITTPALTLTTLTPKVVSAGNVVVAASTNISDLETNVGFEWRKYNAPPELPSSRAQAILYNGQMEGILHNLSLEYWKVRAYYEAADGTCYYGEWATFDPSQPAFFEPTVHTYALVTDPTANKVQMRGYVMTGTDDVTEQGFEYWFKGAKAPRRVASATPDSIYRVQASGQVMTAVLEDLAYSTTYTCRAYAVAGGKTYYGEEVQFLTPEDPRPIYTLSVMAGENGSVNTDVSGQYREGETVTLTATAEQGFRFMQWSDGNTDNPRQLTITANTELVAFFELADGLEWLTVDNAQCTIRKMIIDNQLFIFRGDKIYNAAGVEL